MKQYLSKEEYELGHELADANRKEHEAWSKKWGHEAYSKGIYHQPPLYFIHNLIDVESEESWEGNTCTFSQKYSWNMEKIRRNSDSAMWAKEHGLNVPIPTDLLFSMKEREIKEYQNFYSHLLKEFSGVKNPDKKKVPLSTIGLLFNEFAVSIEKKYENIQYDNGEA